MKIKKFSSAILFLVFSAVFFSTCDIGLGASVDTEAPVGAITSPEVDAIIRDEFAIQGSWSDDGTIKSILVELKNNGTNETFSYSASVEAEGSWSCVIDPETEGLSDGSYLATIVITDKGAHQTTLTRSYTIDNTAPLLVLTRPSTRADSSSADSYGQTFTLEGQAADDNNVSLIEVYIYGDEECTNLLHTVNLKNVPNTINLDVAKFVEGDTDSSSDGYNYYKMYGSSSKDGEKQLYCKIKAYDGSQRYPVDEKQTDSDTYGNCTETYYLYEDIASYISSYKITGLYSMKNGTYGTDTARASTSSSVLEALESYEASEGTFTLNPANNPTFTVAGYEELSGDGEDFSNADNFITNGNSVVIEVAPGLDSIPLVADDTLQVYVVECDSYGKEVSGAERIYVATAENKTKSGTSYKFVATLSQNKGLVIGSNYIFGVEGSDQKGNFVEAAGSGKGYGFHLASSGVAPSLTLTEPSLSISYLAKGASQTFSGSVSVEAGSPEVQLLLGNTVVHTFTLKAEESSTSEKFYSFSYIVPAGNSGFSQTESGQYAYTVRASQDSLNTDILRTIMYDVDGPNLEFSEISTADYYPDESGASDGKEYLNGTVTFGVTITDDYDTVDSDSVSINVYDGTVTLPKTSFSIDTSQYPDGDFTVSLEAKDRAGNLSSKSVTYSIKQETDNPVIIPNDTGSMSFVDFPTSESVGPDLQTDATSAKNWLASGDALEITLIDDDGLSTCEIYRSGKYTYSAGSSAGSDAAFIYNEDDENTFSEGQLVLQESYSLNGSKNPSKSFKNMPVDAGYYEFKVLATDLNGNTTEKKFWIRITAAAPSVSAQADKAYITTTSEEENAVKSLNVAVSINSDQVPFVITRKVLSASGSEITADSTVIQSDYTETSYTDSFIPEETYTTGSYKLAYTVTDVNGKSGTSGYLTFYVDNDAPAVSNITSPSLSQTEAASYTFKITASDTGGNSSLPDNYYIAFGNASSSVPSTDYYECTSSYTLVFEDESVFETEGEKAVYVKVSDSVGNVSSVSRSTFTYDAAAPIITLTGITEGAVNYFESESGDSVSYVISGTVTESNGLASMTVNGTSIGTLPAASTSAQDWSYTLSLTADTESAVTVVATDKAGRSSSKSFSLYADSEAPNIEITAPDVDLAGDDSLASSSYTFRGSASDSGAGVTEVKYLITKEYVADDERSSITGWTTSSSKAGFSVSKNLLNGAGDSDGSGDLHEGQWYLYMYSVDSVGNEDYETRSFFVDKASPTVETSLDGTSLTSSTEKSVKSITALSFTVEDSNELNSMPYRVSVIKVNDNSTSDADYEVEEVSRTDTSATYSIILNNAENALYTFTISGIDVAGKETQVIRNIRVDSEAPVLTVNSPDFDLWQKINSVTVSGTATDATGVSAVYICQKDDTVPSLPGEDQDPANSEAWTGWTKASGSGSWYSTVEVSDATGHKLYVAAVDTLGNVTDIVEKTLNVDATPAEVEALYYQVGSGSLTSASGSVYVNGSKAVTVYGSVSDATSGLDEMNFTIGGSEKTPAITYYSDENFTTLASDTDSINYWKTVFSAADMTTGTFVVKASDNAGNTTTKNSFTVVLDQDKPTMANLAISSSYSDSSDSLSYFVKTEDGNIIFSGTASDNTGVSSVNLVVSYSGGGYNETISSNPSVWTFEVDLSALEDGQCASADLTVTDLAGNEKSYSITLTADNEGPVAYHQVDYNGKDIYFRLGDADNELSELKVWDETITSLADEDEAVGGKYSYGTYGNTSVITVSGNINDASGSGVKMIYYKIYTTEPSSDTIASFVTSPDALKDGSFSPLSSADIKRVKYSNGENSYEFKEVETTYRANIAGLTNERNYVVFVAEDNVGNIAADTLKINNDDDTDGTNYGSATVDGAEDLTNWNGGDSSNTGKAYFSLNYDSVVPELSTDVTDIKYTNKSGTMTITGSASDGLSGISLLSLTANGKTISAGSSSDYGSLTLDTTGLWTANLDCSKLFASLATKKLEVVYLNASDNAGNSCQIVAASVTIDTDAPVVSLQTSPSDADSSSSGTQVNKTITIAGSSSDTGAGIRSESVSDGVTDKTLSLWYKQSDSSITSVTSIDGWTKYDSIEHDTAWSFEVDTTDTDKFTDGKNYYFTVEAYDNAGNVGYMTPLALIVKQDTDRPLVTFTNLTIDGMDSSEYVWLKNTTTLMGIVSDDDGISSMKYSTDNQNWQNVTVSNGSWSITLGEGASELFFNIEDSEGETFTSAASASGDSVLETPKLSDGTTAINSGIPVYLKVDKTSPVTRNMKYAYYNGALTSPAYTELSSTLETVGGKRTMIQLNLDAGDENDIESVEVSITVDDSTTSYQGVEQTSSAEAESDGKIYSNWTVSDIEVSSLASGNHYAVLTVTDKAGLTKTDSIVVSVDNTASTVSVKNPSSSTSVSGEVSAYGTLTESSTLYYSVSPAAEDPDSISTVSAWYDGEGNSNSMSAVAVDGWTQVEDASLSWTVNFNNADSTSSGTNAKSLNKYIIDYGIASKDETSSATDAIVSSFETIVKLYLHLKSVDAVGNEYITSYPILVDPQGDRPTVAFSYPSSNAVTLGGTVSIYGTATDTVGSSDSTIGVDSVWVQIKSTTHRAAEDTTTYGTSPSYDSSSDSVSMTLTEADLDYMAANGYSVYKVSSYSVGGTNTAWVSGSSSLASGDSASDYAALASLSGAAWSIEINKTASDNLYEFDPPSGVSSNPVAIRVFARDYDGKLSLKTERYVSFDADTPVISELYLVQSSDEKISTASTASKAYSQDMYVKDSWYLTGTATDKDKIAVLKIGDTKLVDSSVVVAAYSDCVTISSDGTTVEFKYPLATGSGVGALSFTVSATDAATGTSHTGSESISIKYDNTAPEIAASTSSAFNISSDICQSNSWYTFGSAAYEAAVGNASQSGFAYTAFYFQRTYTNASGGSVNNIYDILQAKADAAVALGSAVPALGEESASIDNTLVSDSGLYWYRKAISNISGSTFTVTDTTGVRVNALMKIEGSLYLITAVNGTSVTVDATLPSDAELAYVAIAGIIDNTTPESAPSTGTIEDDGYYESPSRDDGDRMIESVDKSGTSWTWEANVCSRNIADGPITLYYVVFDKAGNYATASVEGTVSNNKPRIAGALVKTDYNGDGDVTDDGETINTYGAAKSYAEYYTGTSSSGAYIYDPDEKVKNTNAKNPLPTSVTYGADDEPIAALRGYTLIQPEIVGGNGALYYSYSVTNGSAVTSGNNSTAFIEEGSEDYTAVTGSINVQLGDLLNFGDTSDSASAIPFEFTIWDSTEGLTAFTSSQNAKLTMYFAIQAASVGTPSASITPFYWNSISDNSVYGSSSASSYADLKGHIELEDDLPSANFSSGGSGEYDLDPKVSGKITVAGAAEDTKLIALLTASIFGSSYEVATYSSETGLLASNYAEGDFATNGFWFEIVDQTVGSDGHVVNWKLHIDTEVLGVAAKDLLVTMSATNFGKPSASTGGTLTSIDGTTRYSSTLTYTNAASSVPGTVQTSASAATAYYRMDVVPYVVGVKTSLSSLKKKNSSVYDRTALGHYPTAKDDTVYLYGFNLASATLYDSASSANSAALTTASASSQSWYSSSYFDYDTVYSADVSSFTSGNVYVSVNGVSSLNNVNSNNASGAYTAASISDSSTYSVKNTYAYNRMPNNDNNNNLTDDLVLDVWAFDSDAVVPISGKIEQPHMAIDPVTGQIGFAFVNGPLYFSMTGSKENSTKTSYDYWMGSYDFFTSVGFTYDTLGYAYGVAAGGDINSASADKFQFMTSRWGRASRAQNGSYSSSNSLRLESIGQKGDSAGNNTDTRYFDKQRIKSPSLTTAVHDKYTNVYLAYYDAMNDEIRFKAGSTNSTATTNFGSFTDYDTAGDPYVYRHEKVSMIAGSDTGYGAGSYVSLGVVPGASSTTDVVVAVWYDETERVLWYSYNTTPLTDRNGTTDRSGWSTPVQVFSGDIENAGEYCQLTVDVNAGIHIAAYDGTNCDLVYAYLSSYSASPSTCVVDGSGVIGSNLTIDVALDASGNAIPRIGYYATSCIRPKLAYLVDTSSTAPDGSDDEAFTGAWECTVVPTDSSVNMQSNQYNKINVGVWKSSGVITSSTSGTSSYTNTPNSYNSTSYGFVYGNGSSNAVLGYAIKVSSSSDAIETAQMQ